MIHRIYSDLESFRELQLMPGLNVLLADKSEESTDKQTRNGAGKTSLIELIHFALGGTADKNSIFRTEMLAPWRFGLELDLAERRVSVERSGATHLKVTVAGEEISPLPLRSPLGGRSGALNVLKPDRQEMHRDRAPVEGSGVEHGKAIVTAEGMSGLAMQSTLGGSSVAETLSNSRWREVLGELVFKLPADSKTDRGKFAPTFRSLFPYFVRRHDSGGFASHIAQSSRQLPWDQHVAISFLLGLDWSVSKRFQELREQEKSIKELKKVAKRGSLPGLKGSAAYLRTQVTLAASKARQLKRQLDAFNVVPEYESIEREASKLTQDMNRAGNENTSDRQLLDQLRSSLEGEEVPAGSKLEALFIEADLVFPELVTRRFHEAAEFHRVIIENRKAHLRSEIERAEERISQRDEAKAAIGQRRAELMKILESGGALEQYTLLQEEHARLQVDAEMLKQQLATAEKLESEQTRAEIERRQLQERLRQDFQEHDQVLSEAIILFEELSEALYERERAGKLTIDATDNGPTFEVQIDSQRSRGITNMQIFCFDMVLSVLASRRGLSPGFLAHDSHLFDGVDERQVAKALQIGKARAEECGFQYLVTMNSDALPQDGFDPGFDVSEHVLPVKLDDTPQGGLFGARFG